MMDRQQGMWAWVVLSTALALASMTAADAEGVTLEAVPSIRFEEGWNSNVFNAGENEVSSFGTRVTPGLGLNFHTSETSQVKLFGSYERIWYNSTEAKPAESSTVYVRLEAPEAVKVSPNWSLNPSAYYINTTNSYRRIQLLPSGDPVLPPVTTTNYGNTRTETFGGAVAFDYQLTPVWSFGVTGSYTDQRFGGASDNAASTGFSDSATAGGNVTVSYQLSPTTKLGIVVAGNHQTFDPGADADTLSGGITVGYKFSERMSLEGAFGMSYAQQDAVPGIQDTQRTSSPAGLFTLTYAAETFHASLFGSALYSGGSGFGTTTWQYTAGLNLSDQFARDWFWRLSGSYQISESAFGDAVDLNSTYGTAGITYKPWKWLGFDLSGSLNRQTSSGQFGSTVDGYAVILGFVLEESYTVF
jgi:hypothetical protein